MAIVVSIKRVVNVPCSRSVPINLYRGPQKRVATDRDRQRWNTISFKSETTLLSSSNASIHVLSCLKALGSSWAMSEQNSPSTSTLQLTCQTFITFSSLTIDHTKICCTASERLYPGPLNDLAGPKPDKELDSSRSSTSNGAQLRKDSTLKGLWLETWHVLGSIQL